MSNCEMRNDEYYLRLSTQNSITRTVQIRPWQLSGMDHVFVQDLSELQARFTVFVGGVPRTLSAGKPFAIFVHSLCSVVHLNCMSEVLLQISMIFKMIASIPRTIGYYNDSFVW